MKTIKTLFFILMAFQFLGQITVFEADFQGGIPSEMIVVDNDFNIPNAAVSEYADAWICVADPENPDDSVAASTSWFTPVDTANRWLITPQLNLGSYGNSILWNSKSQDASFPDDYLILASSTDSNPSSFLDTLGYIQQENFEWTSRSVDLSSEGYNDQSIYIAFVLRTYDGFKLYVDDIQVLKEDDASNQLFSNVDFRMSPNPCQDIVQISAEKPIEQIKIYNLSGQLILSTANSIIQTSTLKRGSYIVEILSGKYSSHKRLYKL